MSFEGLIGNDKIKGSLIDAIKNESVVHSYMFIGQDGIGKKRFAQEFAKMILCLSDVKESCDRCDSCIKYTSGNHPDFIQLEPDGNSIKIAQIRQMQENIYQKPIVSNKKVFIINDAEKMTEEAQNSLLKTLEEPPVYVVIILIVSNENLLLNTIKSRCLRIYFKNIPRENIISYINENGIIKEANENIVDMCNGSFSKLENISENLEKYLEVEKLFMNILTKKEMSIIDIFNSSEVLYKSKDDIQDILEYMIVILYNKIRSEQKNNLCYEKYFTMIKIIEDTRKKLNSNSNYDMCIDEMLLTIKEVRG